MGQEKDFYLNHQMVKARVSLVIGICVSGNPAQLRRLKIEFQYCSEGSKRSKTVIFGGRFLIRSCTQSKLVADPPAGQRTRCSSTIYIR